ncbi:MAG: hypothetical protein IKN57_05960, partial [Parasporobacterium sp.]|nr:hypothetical protein [Parasporobacterium sp.]
MSRRNRKNKLNEEWQEPSNTGYFSQEESGKVGENPIPETIMQEPVWLDVDDRGAHRGLRVFAIVMALVLTVVIAVGTGIALAL